MGKRLYIRYTLWTGTKEYEICIPSCPVKVDMLFGWWFTGNVALGAQIIEIVEL